MSPRTLTLIFLAVLGFYLVGFYGLEHLRTRKGPWEARFESSAGGAPTVTVNQPHVGVTGLKLVFHGESATNAPGTVRFDGVEKSALFGEVIYEDLTFLPGVVTFNLFGHEIELLPRVLVVNKREVPWQSGTVIDLWPSNKPPVAPKAPKGNRPVPTR